MVLRSLVLLSLSARSFSLLGEHVIPVSVLAVGGMALGALALSSKPTLLKKALEEKESLLPKKLAAAALVGVVGLGLVYSLKSRKKVFCELPKRKPEEKDLKIWKGLPKNLKLLKSLDWVRNNYYLQFSPSLFRAVLSLWDPEFAVNYPKTNCLTRCAQALPLFSIMVTARDPQLLLVGAAHICFGKVFDWILHKRVQDLGNRRLEINLGEMHPSAPPFEH